jgi:hypothetical protein
MRENITRMSAILVALGTRFVARRAGKQLLWRFLSCTSVTRISDDSFHWCLSCLSLCSLYGTQTEGVSGQCAEENI